METFANRAASTLDGSINDTQTTIDVVDAASFPATGNFRITVADEFMLVTGVSGDEFTVIRGIEGSTAASHSSGAAVTHVVTAAVMNRIQAVTGLYAPFTTPVNGDFSWLNQDDAILTPSTDSILLEGPANSNVWDIHGRMKTRDSGTTKVTAGFQAVFGPQQQCHCGIFTHNTGNSRVETFSVGTMSNNWSTSVVRYNSPTSVNFTQFSDIAAAQCFTPLMVWLQTEQSGNNLIYRVSPNGYDWQTITTVDYTGFLGTVDRVGFHVTPYSRNSRMRLFSWLEE